MHRTNLFVVGPTYDVRTSVDQYSFFWKWTSSQICVFSLGAGAGAGAAVVALVVVVVGAASIVVVVGVVVVAQKSLAVFCCLGFRVYRGLGFRVSQKAY